MKKLASISNNFKLRVIVTSFLVSSAKMFSMAVIRCCFNLVICR